jgi:hypothetical protein
MNFNYNAPPQTSSSDRQKFKIFQDDILAVQIANDQNIANARQNQVVLKIPQALTPIESMSPSQLLADESGQEMLAQQNLKQLNFRDQEISDIMVQIRRDPQLSFLLLNSNFPAIKAELEKRFNIKLVTPTFFVDFLKAYLVKVSKSLGLTQYSRNKNDSVDTVEELKTILPDVNDVAFLLDQAQRLNYDQLSLETLTSLINSLPTEQDYADIANVDPITRQDAMKELLIIMKDLPSASQINSLVKGIQNDTVDLRAFNDAMTKLIKSIDITLRKPQLAQVEVEEEILIQPRRRQKQIPPVQLSTPLKQNLPVQLSTPSKVNVRDQVLSPLKDTILSDIRSFLNANPEIKNQVIEKSTGDKVRPSMLRKTDGKGGVWIYNTNLPELWKIYNTDLSFQFPTTEGYGIGHMNMVQKQPRNMIRMGKGISAVEQPSYKEFGKFCINIPHLENQDILNVKYKNCLGAIPSFKPTAISDIFRDFIIDLLDTGKANTRVYNQISDEERKYFQKVATAAGIFKGMGLPITTTDDEEKDVKRFEILRGQITAGNNNPKLLDETRKLVVRLMNADRLKKKAGLDILLELSAM